MTVGQNLQTKQVLMSTPGTVLDIILKTKVWLAYGLIFLKYRNLLNKFYCILVSLFNELVRVSC